MRIQASRVKARRRTVRLLVFLQTALSDFPLRMQLLLSAAHANGLRRCPSSDLLIQSGWASHHKTFRGFSRSLSHFLAVRPAYRNTALYLHTPARKLRRQPNHCSKECVRNEDEESLICKRRMTKELKRCLFQNNLFSQSILSLFIPKILLPPGRVIHNSHSFLSVEAPAAREIPLECN